MDTDPTPSRSGLDRLRCCGPRGRWLLWAALGSVVAVLATAVLTDDRKPTGDPTVGDVVRVGVVEGDSIPGYLRSSGAELAALAAGSPPGPGHPEPYALVTFASYLSPDQLTPVVAGTSVSAVVSRVPLPGRQTQIVRIPAQRIPVDVFAGMAQVAERKDREARDYQDRSAALGEGGDPQLRRVYDSGARVALAEAAAYRSHCGCVYAVVVRAVPAVLERLSRRPDVRVVDPAPEVRRLDRAVFLPPLPEQTDLVRPLVDNALPQVESIPDKTADGGVNPRGMAHIGFAP